MIVTEFVTVRVSGKIIDHLRRQGYNVKHNDIINIKPSELMSGSSIVIRVNCDYCGFERNIIYSEYFKQMAVYNLNCCNKCKGIKIKDTTMLKYGVNNISQLDSVKEKKKNTCLINYGVENPSHSKEILNRIKDTFLKNYGVEHVFQNKIVYDKFKQTMYERYGSEHALQNEILFQKCQNTCNKNHNVSFALQSKKIREHMYQTNLLKYGVKHSLQNIDIFIKNQKSSFLIKYHKDMKLKYRGTYEEDFFKLLL